MAETSGILADFECQISQSHDLLKEKFLADCGLIVGGETYEAHEGVACRD